MDKRKLNGKADWIHLACRGLTPNQYRAIRECKMGNDDRFDVECQRIRSTIFKMRASCTGKDDRWEQGMILHLERILRTMIAVRKCIVKQRRTLKRGAINGKRHR